MRKRTSLRTPKNPKASPNQTSGLIAKGQNPGQSVQEECVLDNRSHRTFRASEPAPITSFPGSAFFETSHPSPGSDRLSGRLGRRPPQAAAAGGPFVMRWTVPSYRQVP